MNLNDFIETEKKLLDEFKAYWEAEHQKDPDNWPLELDEGEWVQMLMAHGL